MHTKKYQSMMYDILYVRIQRVPRVNQYSKGKSPSLFREFYHPTQSYLPYTGNNIPITPTC